LSRVASDQSAEEGSRDDDARNRRPAVVVSEAPRPRRELERRRIRLATSGLAVAAAVGTAIFAGLAAETTKHARAQASFSGVSPAIDPGESQSDDGFSTLTPPSSVPQQSFESPMATSGGS
jgi:hypothetical protein